MQLASPKLLPRLDRPREKLIHGGAARLTDLELLQLIIGSGVKGHSVTDIAGQVLDRIKSSGYLYTSIHSLVGIKGLSSAKMAAILAAMEFAHRYHLNEQIVLDTPAKVLPLVTDIAGAKQENLVLITIDGAFRLLNKRLVSLGTLTNTLVHPREVFADAVADRAACVILVHNHPSNICIPSGEDKSVTKAMCEAGKLLGIPVYDHIIITKNNGWYSMRQGGEVAC